MATLVIKLTTFELAQLIPNLDRVHERLDVFTGDGFVDYRPANGTLAFVNGAAEIVIDSGEQFRLPNPGDAWIFITLLTYQSLREKLGEVEQFVRADVIPDFVTTWAALGKDPGKILVHPDRLLELQSYLASIRAGLRAHA